jgi:hypothetical protein
MRASERLRLLDPRPVRGRVTPARPSDYPRVFTPAAPDVFRADSTNSLVAAYSHDELAGAVERAFESARREDGTIRGTWPAVPGDFWRIG